MKKILLSLFFMIPLSACVKPDASLIGPYPKNHKAIVKSYIESSFFDPYSLRSVSISGPMQGHILFQQGWVVCLRANAKNRMGAYTGLSYTAFLINNDTVVLADSGFQACTNMNYTPWPEMEAR